MALFNKLLDSAKKMGGQATSAVNGMLTKQTSSDGSYDVSGAVNLRESIPKMTENVAALISPAQKVIGSQRTISIFGGRLEITPAQDAYNSYYKIITSLAKRCAEKANREYGERVTDYISFIENFPAIYDNNLFPLLKYALDTLFLENIWSVTEESFANLQKEKSHFAIDFYDLEVTAGNKASEATKEAVSDMSNRMAGKLGGKYTGLASDIFERFSSQMISSAVSKVGVSVEQQKSLFAAIKVDALQDAILADYVEVGVTMLEILVDNGKEIRCPSAEERGRAEAIMNNLLSPSFPSDRIKDAIIQVMQNNPYHHELFPFLLDHFGKDAEIVSVATYFGYDVSAK